MSDLPPEENQSIPDAPPDQPDDADALHTPEAEPDARLPVDADADMAPVEDEPPMPPQDDEPAAEQPPTLGDAAPSVASTDALDEPAEEAPPAEGDAPPYVPGSDPDETPAFPPILPPEPPPDLATRAETDAESAADAATEPIPARRRGGVLRLPNLIAGIVLIALGVVLVWPALTGGAPLATGLAIGIVATGICAALLVYWSGMARMARGALFLALVLLLWGALSAVFVLDPTINGLDRAWPLFTAALGLAVLLTHLLDRQREARLLTPGLILIVGGIAAAAVNWDMLPADVLTLARQVGPWLFVVLALGLLPLAIRRVPRHQAEK